MADGTFAALMILIGLTDMQSNYCKTASGCFARSDVLPRLQVSAGDIIERKADSGKEMYIRYDLGHKNGPFGHAVGFSVSSRQALWAGIGQTYLASPKDSPIKIQLNAMTGLYNAGKGHDLGGLITFRSGIDFVYETDGGVRYGLSHDHRSHMEIYPNNPGVESIRFMISVPFK